MLTPVKSSHIEAIGHDPATNSLTVKFAKNDTPWVYEGVSAEKHAAVMGEGVKDHSVGKAFHAHIIKGGHKSKRLDK